jgi:hypothetical protein
LGYALLHANGGHPDQPGRAVIRRWVAPASGNLTIAGTLHQGSENGDGVRGRIVTSRSAADGSGLLAEWKSHNAPVETPVASLVVEAGDKIDFIVDCLEHNTSDSFQWPVTLTLTTSDGVARSFSSATEFHGPPEPVSVIVGQVMHAWQLAYCRQPEVNELVAAMSFLSGQVEYLQIVFQCWF